MENENCARQNEEKLQRCEVRQALITAYHVDETCALFNGRIKEITATSILFDKLQMEYGLFDCDACGTYQLKNVRINKKDFLTEKQAIEMGFVEENIIEFDNLDVDFTIEFYAGIARHKSKNKPASYRIINIRNIKVIKKKSPHFRENLKRWAEYELPVCIRAHIDEIKKESNLACLNDVHIMDCDYFGEFIDSFETHVWVPFEEIQKAGIWVDDVVEFYADTYEYENSKGELNYGLKNLRDVKISDPRDRIVHDAQALYCDTMCMFRDHCYGTCCANEKYTNSMVQQMSITMCGEQGLFPGTTVQRLSGCEWDTMISKCNDSESHDTHCEVEKRKARGVVYKIQNNIAKVKIFRLVDYKGLGRNVDNHAIEVELQNAPEQYELFDIVELTGTVFCSKRNLDKPEKERKYKLVDYEGVRVLSKDEVIKIAAREATCDSCLLHKWCAGWEQCAWSKMRNNWLGHLTNKSLNEIKNWGIQYRDTVISNMVESLNQMAYTPEEYKNNVIDFMYHRYRFTEGIEPLFKLYPKN